MLPRDRRMKQITKQQWYYYLKKAYAYGLDEGWRFDEKIIEWWGKLK